MIFDEPLITSTLVLGLIVFACAFGGALLGLLLRVVLPEHHLRTESKDVVKLGMGLIATMSALVLSGCGPRAMLERRSSRRRSVPSASMTRSRRSRHGMRLSALSRRRRCASASRSGARWLLLEQRGSSIPLPFMAVLTFWLAMIFMSFAIFAPANTTVIATLLICALSISGAMFLILELDTPFAGLIRISSAPLRDALALLGQ